MSFRLLLAVEVAERDGEHEALTAARLARRRVRAVLRVAFESIFDVAVVRAAVVVITVAVVAFLIRIDVAVTAGGYA
jgi:hypothetical protein